MKVTLSEHLRQMLYLFVKSICSNLILFSLHKNFKNNKKDRNFSKIKTKKNCILAFYFLFQPILFDNRFLQEKKGIVGHEAPYETLQNFESVTCLSGSWANI